MRRLILTNQLGPGDMLPSERELEARLDVGRSTVREAIATLASEGLLRIIHGSGMKVRSWLSEGSFDLVSALLTVAQGDAFVKQLLWLRRALYTSLAAEWTTPRPDFGLALGARQEVFAAGYHGSGSQVALMLDREERLLCVLAGDVNLPAAMLGHGIRRALRGVIERAELPAFLPTAYERFDALVEAVMAGRSEPALVDEVCRLREQVYRDAALHSASAQSGK